MSRIEDSMGISYRQLDHWSKEGYLRPHHADTGGQRIWPDEEIRIGRMMARLVAVGITPSYAAKYARVAVIDKTPMLLEFRDGKLRVRGPFSMAIKKALQQKQEGRDARKYEGVDRQDKAC